MTKLFISYAHLDSEIVLMATNELQAAGYEVWIDTHGIRGGTLWGGEIVKGIVGSETLLLFVSSKSIRSDYVRRELDIAFHYKRKIIPVMLEKVDIPLEWDYQLAGLQYIDAKVEDWVPRLLLALNHESSSRPELNLTRSVNPYSVLPSLEPIERALILSNRKNELDKSIQYLKSHRLLLVTGMPGIGKSTFARTLVEFMPASSPPAFWYNFERYQSSGNTLGSLLERISDHLDKYLQTDARKEVMAFRASSRNASVNDVDILIGFLNQETPIWLIFDNLETVLSRDTQGFLDEGLEILFESLKNSTHNAKVILTNPFIPVLNNGERYLEIGTLPLALNGLDEASAIDFLHAYGLQDVPEASLASLVQGMNGHPFLLNYIASYIKTMGITATQENLQVVLEEVNERFGNSLEQRLSSSEFTALQTMTILQREISLKGVCQIAQVKPGIIIRLREMGLLQANDLGKYWLHNIVRSSLKPITPDAKRQTHLRAMGFYHEQEIKSPTQNIDDYASVLEWHYHAIEAEDTDSAYSAIYATGLEEQLLKWNEYGLVHTLCHQTLTLLRANQTTPNNDKKISLYHSLGIVSFFQGNFIESINYLKSALDLLKTETRVEIKIKLLIDLSESYNGIRDFETAMEICQQAIVQLSDGKNENLKAKALHLRGIIHRDLGAMEAASADLEAARKLYESQGDKVHLANVIGDLGIVYYNQNQFSKAVENYRQVIELFDEHKDIRAVAITHFNLGDILLLSGQYDQAAHELQAAVDISRKRKFMNLELAAGLSLVEAQLEMMQLEPAEAELEFLKPLVEKNAQKCFIGRELALSASLHGKRKDTNHAEIFFKKALEILKDPDCKEECARAQIAFADFKKELGDSKQAVEALLQAKGLFTEINNQLGMPLIERALANLQNGQTE